MSTGECAGGDIKICIDHAWQEYLEFEERPTKIRQRANPRDVRSVQPKMWACSTEPEKCPVAIYKEYAPTYPASHANVAEAPNDVPVKVYEAMYVPSEGSDGAWQSIINNRSIVVERIEENSYVSDKQKHHFNQTPTVILYVLNGWHAGVSLHPPAVVQLMVFAVGIRPSTFDQRNIANMEAYEAAHLNHGSIAGLRKRSNTTIRVGDVGSESSWSLFGTRPIVYNDKPGVAERHLIPPSRYYVPLRRAWTASDEDHPPLKSLTDSE
ncbi:hypothetical protein MAR_020115 [Mya arenaria]|uniref:Uncharacterized protein n=1 Tax=Mya arenaria TaxID=6604 RepID=A0ABY7E734_MYAAR|nr:hypothetical protein MAR_020115 [Mya arenaria]